jgi:hypothetical protein
MRGFRLRKWYLDCVADDGSTLIGYRARLEWAPLAVEYAAVLAAPAAGEVRQLHSFRPSLPPTLNRGVCGWSCPSLGVDGRWEATARGVGRVLLRSEAGGIRWRCHQPGARTDLRLDRELADVFGRERLCGVGYVEELELTVAPWRLPFDTLHWGRFVTPEHHLVWIQWQRSRPVPAAGMQTVTSGGMAAPPAMASRGLRLAILNGTPVRGAQVSDRAIRLSGRGTLEFGEPRRLREGPLVQTVLGAAPLLTRRLPPTFTRAHEAKRLSRARLTGSDLPGVDGWAIHEVVRW